MARRQQRLLTARAAGARHVLSVYGEREREGRLALRLRGAREHRRSKNIQLGVSCAGVAVVGRILPQENTRVTRAEHSISKRLTARRDAARKELEKAYVAHLRLHIFGFIAEVLNILLVRRDCRISPQHGRADNSAPSQGLGV
jgi:hypothetical protein